MKRRSRRSNSPVMPFVGGLVVGVCAGWLTAPRRGDWVRNQLAQKAEHWRRLSVRTLGKRGRDVGNRVRGGLAEVRRAWVRPDPYVDANTLVDQVHSQLGRKFADVLEGINLNAYGHTVYLHGYTRTEGDRDRLVDAIRGVEGVGDVASMGVRVLESSSETGAAADASSNPEAPRRTRRRAT